MMILANINGLHSNGDRAKNDLLKDLLSKQKADIIALQEVNVN